MNKLEHFSHMYFDILFTDKEICDCWAMVINKLNYTYIIYFT
jgi:hypothetical protein